MSFWVKICKYVDLGQFCFFENIDFGESCRKVSNLVKNLDLVKLVRILDFDQNLKNCDFWSKYKEMIFVKIIKNSLILVKQKFKQISILVKIYKNLHFGQNLPNC